MPQQQADAGTAEQSTHAGKPVGDPAALRDDEISYRQLFDNMAEGFALHEIITDASGRVIDFRFLAANPAFDRHTGMQGSAIVGKTMLELVPSADRHQIEAYGRVALTGEPLSFEYRSDTFGRHVRVRAYSPSPGRFATIFEDITERILAQEKLARSEAMYRLLAENASDAVFMVDADGKEAYISPSFARLLGYAESDLARLDPVKRLESIHPDERAAVVAELQQAKELRLPHSSLQYRVKNKQGDYIWLEINLRREFDSTGQFVREIGVVRDITGHKCTELALRESEERYRMLADNMPDVVFTLDAVGKVTYLSPSVVRLRGYTIEESLAEASAHRHTAASLVSVNRHMATIIAEAAAGKPLSQPYHETEMRRKDGSTLWAETSFMPRYAADGTFAGFVGVMRDISERKRLEEELRGREERLRLVIENSPDVIWIWDQEGGLQFVSQALEPTYGVSPQTMLAAAALTHAHAAKVPASELTVDRLVELGAPNLAFAGVWLKMQHAVKTCVLHLGDKVRHETRLVMPNDQVRYTHTTYQGFRRGPAGVEVVAITHDVTEIVEAREQIHETLRKLRVATDAVHNANAVLEKRVAERTAELAAALSEVENASRLKDEFMAAVSHELRTPLTGVLGIAETLEMQITGPLNERQLRGVRSIRASGNRLLEIVNSILRYIAMAAGNITLRTQPCRLADLAGGAAQWVQPQAAAKGQQLLVEVDPSDPVIMSDADSIRQILQQLLDNAVKFTPYGGSIGLEVQCDDARAYVHLIVWDTGIGIVQEQHTTIFQPFIQVEGGLARRYEGIGLGLAYVARAVEMLGGTVAVKSVPGEGSRFTVTLPTQVRR